MISLSLSYSKAPALHIDWLDELILGLGLDAKVDIYAMAV